MPTYEEHEVDGRILAHAYRKAQRRYGECVSLEMQRALMSRITCSLAGLSQSIYGADPKPVLRRYRRLTNQLRQELAEYLERYGPFEDARGCLWKINAEGDPMGVPNETADSSTSLTAAHGR